MDRGVDEETRDVQTLDGAFGRSYGRDELCIAVSTGGPFQTFALPDEPSATIGRGSASHIRIDDPSVSRMHAKLKVDGDIRIMDLGSSNGVRVGGARIDANQWVAINIGEMVRIGAAHVVVQPRRRVARPRRIWSHGYFESRVEEECARSDRSGTAFGVLHVRLPDSDPSAGGEIEDTFASWLRAADVLARYAPGEYEVLFVDLSPDQAAAAADRLVDQLAAQLSCSPEGIQRGLACFPRDHRSAGRLLSHAKDLARGPRTRASRPSMDIVETRSGFREQLARVADSTMSVLILGETGVGKEVCAEALHRQSSRAAQKLLRLNCAALSETLLESELFGYERGAFTGAAKSKPGLLETAQGGTVFLDEIGEIPSSTQVKLLRVLEERKVQRIGALEPRDIDVRFVSATNRDLEVEVRAGRFRQDLLFRLNTFTLHIPPLRQRVPEILPLATEFLARARADLGHRDAPPLSAAVVATLERYAWPGNIRELRNVMERAAVLAGGGPNVLEHLPLDKMNATVVPSLPSLRASAPADNGALDLDALPTGRIEPPARRPTDSLHDEVRELERDRIVSALDECAGNQTQAAKRLGISRGTLIKRLDAYGIPRPRKR